MQIVVPASGGVSLAEPAGVSYPQTADPVAGSGEITVVEFPRNMVAFAFELAGDAFPRVLFLSDATDGIYLGDGTFDPYSGAAALRYSHTDGYVYVNGPQGKASLGGEVYGGSGLVGFYAQTGITQQAAIAAPAGGVVIDVQARAVIQQIVDFLSGTPSVHYPAGGIGLTL